MTLSTSGDRLRRGPLRRTLDAVYLASGVAAALAMVAILGIILGQMAARWFGFQFPGSTAYAGYAMAAASFLALPYAMNRGAHIRVGLFLAALGRHRHWGELWCLAIGAVLASYFAWYAIKATRWSYRFDEVSQGLDATPIWIPQLAMCVGTALLAVALWDNLICRIVARTDNIRIERADGA